MICILDVELIFILHDKINKNTFVVGQQPPTFRHPHCQGSPQTSSLTLEVWCLHFLIESSLLTCVLVSNLFHQYSGQKFSIWNAKWFLLRLIRLFSNTCITFDEKSIHHTHTIKDAWKAHLYLGNYLFVWLRHRCLKLPSAQCRHTIACEGSCLVWLFGTHSKCDTTRESSADLHVQQNALVFWHNNCEIKGRVPEKSVIFCQTRG